MGALRLDQIDFDDLELPLAELAAAGIDSPRPELKARILAAIADRAAIPPVPTGFSFKLASDEDWLPHPVPGIRMRVLALTAERATLLLDVEPGARFPAHHHGGDEECYVLSGTVWACGRKMGPGDFHHADGGSDHGELWTDDGCRVLLVVAPEDFLPPAVL
jgi:anti-sigma factor ChrR (cupin superfamily)